MNGFKKPSGGLPLAALSAFKRANTPATTGHAAEVPPTPTKELPFPIPESTATQYGFCTPANAATSGYARPVEVKRLLFGRVPALLADFKYEATASA
jgi:hypothetical protein